MCVDVFCFRAKLDNVRILKQVSHKQNQNFHEVVEAYPGSSTRSSPCTTRSQSPACTFQAEALGSMKEFTITMEELSKVGFDELLDLDCQLPPEHSTTPKKAKNEQGAKETPGYKFAMSKASFESKVFSGEDFVKSSTNESLSSTRVSDGEGDAESRDAEDADDDDDDDDEDADSLQAEALAAAKNKDRFKSKAWMKTVVTQK